MLPLLEPMLKNSCFQAQQLIKMPLTFYFKVSRHAVCDWQNPNHHDIETCFTVAPLVTLKGQENQKALMVAQAKSLMVVSAK